MTRQRALAPLTSDLQRRSQAFKFNSVQFSLVAIAKGSLSDRTAITLGYYALKTVGCKNALLQMTGS
jgi:hypothetical protein